MRFGDARRIALRQRADEVEHDPHHRGHHVVVEEAVHHPRVERLAAIFGQEADATRMHQVEMLDDDRRLDDRAAVIDQHRHALQRPECRELPLTDRIAEI